MSRKRRGTELERMLHTNRRAQGAGYRLDRQRPGTRVALSLSPLGPDHRGVRMGYVTDHIGDRLEIQWDDDAEPEVWKSGDARYKVDRGLMVLTPPKKPRRTRIPASKLECKQCGKLRKDCGCPRIGAQKPEEWGVDRNHLDRLVGSSDPALTGEEQEDIVGDASGGDTPITEERDANMTKQDEKFSAKEVARQLGIDARTLRKFLRSEASPVEPPGQGGRYEFTAKQVKKVKKAFESWGSRDTKSKDKPPKDLPITDVVELDDEVEDTELEGPSDEELEEIELDDDLEGF